MNFDFCLLIFAEDTRQSYLARYISLGATHNDQRDASKLSLDSDIPHGKSRQRLVTERK
jgi:hypothetical protein